MSNYLRIKELLDKMDMPVFRFEQEIKVPQSRIAKALQRESDLKDGTIEKIVTRFPNIRKEWIMKGTGTPRVNEKLDYNETNKVLINSKGVGEALDKITPLTKDSLMGAAVRSEDDISRSYDLMVTVLTQTPTAMVLAKHETEINDLKARVNNLEQQLKTK